jgi:hypothetical protein
LSVQQARKAHLEALILSEGAPSWRPAVNNVAGDESPSLKLSMHLVRTPMPNQGSRALMQPVRVHCDAAICTEAARVGSLPPRNVGAVGHSVGI